VLKNLTETARARPIVIQSLFLKIRGEAMPPGELRAYCDCLNEIVRGGGQVKEVHAYTIARPTPEPFAAKLSAEELNTLTQIIRRRTVLAVFPFDLRAGTQARGRRYRRVPWERSLRRRHGTRSLS